jgi:ankyrin repeat protein
MISAWYKGTSAGSVERVIRLVQIVRTDAFYLAEKGDLSSLHDLYARGKGSIHDVNSSDGKTALMFAVRSNCFALIRYLLSQGADLIQQDFAGWDTRDIMLESYLNPSQDSHEELCAFFDVNDALEEQEFTLIHRIVLGRSSRNLTEELAEHPDLLDRPDSKGRTPLYWAVWCGDFESVRLLLQHGADVSIPSNKGNNIYHVMATSPVGGEIFSFIDQGSGHVQCSMKMQSHCLNVQNLTRATPWHRAIRFDQTTLLKSFLKYMPDLDAKDGCEMTFFHYAALYANTEMLYLLIIADLDQVDLLAECMYGNAGVDYVVARLSDDVYWNEAPNYSEEAAEALVRFVAHARKFEPRLPRLIHIVQGERESRLPAYGLLYPDGLCKIYHGIRAWDVYDYEDLLGMWVDVEDWLEEQGQLNMHEAWKSDSDGIDGPKDKHDSKEEDEEESFFDAMDSSYTCGSTPPNCPNSPANPQPSGTPGSDRVEASSGKVDTGWHNRGPPARCMQRASNCDAKCPRSTYLIIPGGRRLFKSR